MAGTRVSRENLGAWILKCNPRVTDLTALMEQGVATWCVQPNYRSALFAPGQPALLWVSGPAKAVPTPGIWATGQLTGPADWRPPSPADPPKYVVPLELTFLHAPLPRTVLVDHPALTALEVLNQPQMSNPSFATRAQYGALQDLLND
ncbi:hypothetical protein [Kribbella sp. CA-293567]|uniref:hypothetical protein n=1 Tax=Kribbella sp. CA-293567 TaxID=3002436 RepID=UPI0022DD156D|nr:hypothetical protein [Kribbella sp. CA-293567]WBQ06179.1 hypothetical protein OX958_05080 [Kribbella sp. CA-293567]